VTVAKSRAALEASRRYRERHREEINAKRRQKGRKRTAGDAEAHRRWKAANPEKVLEHQRQYVERNRDAVYERERGYRATRPDAYRAGKLRAMHGMQPEDWQALWDAQQGCCYLCENPLPLPGEGKTVIDHDHQCCPEGRSCKFCRRGLACNNCNMAIGLAGEDPARLRRMADNLEAAQRLTLERLAAKSRQPTLFDAGDDPPEELTEAS
jgi:hypothetical protein